jgi:tRNA (pseudouridine54-N1)-methyltransferase
MREFIYFSTTARTSGNFNTDNLMKAGRMDIVCNALIHTFFLSHQMREDTKMHLIFYGPPTPPRHLIIQPKKYLKNTGKEAGSPDLSKKDIAGLIKKMLYKFKGDPTEVFPGYFVEKKNLFEVLDELREEGKEIYLLDSRGEDVRNIDFKQAEKAVFLVGDHKGLPKKELKRLKKTCSCVSVGNRTYFASQVITILNNELDRKGI